MERWTTLLAKHIKSNTDARKSTDKTDETLRGKKKKTYAHQKAPKKPMLPPFPQTEKTYLPDKGILSSVSSVLSVKGLEKNRQSRNTGNQDQAQPNQLTKLTKSKMAFMMLRTLSASKPPSWSSAAVIGAMRLTYPRQVAPTCNTRYIQATCSRLLPGHRDGLAALRIRRPAGCAAKPSCLAGIAGGTLEAFLECH